ncbi:MAG TPA: hypothetical protein VMU54_17380 [Planctomycetota bacterium]|nr:hypothetical protein [Planctomycetota bacterium]
MGDDKKKGGGGGYKWGSAFIWAGGQWAVNWFLTPDTHLWSVISACFSAFFAGWTTSALLGRFARWGANSWVMMILGVLIGVAVFSGAFSGISTAVDWWNAKNINVDWDKLQASLLTWSIVPPIALGLVTGLYVRANTPKGGKK